MSRTKLAFGALVCAQAAHSVEEYLGRFWESFPPARFVSGMVATDRELGFVIANSVLVALGVWCWLWPVRREWPSAGVVAWLWVGLELVNGLVHPAWSVRQGGYTPGVLTAPILFGIALYLAVQLRGQSRTTVPAT